MPSTISQSIICGTTCVAGTHTGSGAGLTGIKPSNLTTTVTTLGSSTYTLQTCDSGSIIRYNGATNATITIPSGIMNTGDQVMFLQAGAGAVVVCAGAGVTRISSNSANQTVGQYSTSGLIKTATDEWLLVGDIC